MRRLSAPNYARGYDFSSAHGRKQRAIIDGLAQGGRAAIAVGAAGAGKTALIDPIVDAYRAEGWQVFGVALAWRQTQGLVEAGVERERAFALTPFLKAAEANQIPIDGKTLVVLDEIATIGTRQLLGLARLQARHGFKLIGLGDDKQCAAIEAGSTVELFRRALGEEQVPELLDTIRQQRIEDRETAALFREGNAKEALARKDAAGLLKLAPGSYGDAIRLGVDEWQSRLKASCGRKDYSIGISVPTNADAHAVGIEIRERARAAGVLQGDDWNVKATDQRGRPTELAIAVGDKVRLFQRVNASFGHNSRGFFGDNGTVAELVSIDTEGVRLRRYDGRIGAIRWSSLTDEKTGRIKLAYGYALTIDARQGDTLTDHVTILPNGTAALTALKIYPADTRNRENSVLVVSQGAEKEAVIKDRLLGDPWIKNARPEEMRSAIMDAIAHNLSRQPAKTLASDLIEMANEVQRGGIKSQLASWHRQEQSGPLHRIKEVFEQRRDYANLGELLSAIKRSAIDMQRVLAGAWRERTPVDMQPRTEFAEALERAGIRLKGDPVMDGEWHRAAVEGDRGFKESARYVGYLDERPAGFIQNFKTGFAESWQSKQPAREIGAEERQRIAAARRDREAERHAAENRAVSKASEIWGKAHVANRHDYLARKGVRSHGLRETRWRALVVPLKDVEGILRNVQIIKPSGEKLFLKGGRTHGLFATIGELRPEHPVLIAEGYATAATLHEATGMPVVVALNGGNLLPVAQALHRAWPDMPLVLAADDDRHLAPQPNVGIEKARAAAEAVGGFAIAPQFAAHEHGATDWNDYGALRGRGAVREAIASGLRAHGLSVPHDASGTTAGRPTAADRDLARGMHAASSPIAPHQAAEQARQRDMRRQVEQRRHNHGPSL